MTLLRTSKNFGYSKCPVCNHVVGWHLALTEDNVILCEKFSYEGTRHRVICACDYYYDCISEEDTACRF